MSSVVVLRTQQGVPRFSLEVLCNEIPCRAISLYDRSTEDTAVRFMSKSAGVLLFKLRNLSTQGSHYFSVFKAELSPNEKWDASKKSSSINKVNILHCGEVSNLQRDKTTGCAINLEFLKDKQGRVLKDSDVEKEMLARTKWRLQVTPTDDWVGPGRDLNTGSWTIHNLLANDLPITLDMNGGTSSTLELKRGVSTARDVKNSLGHLFGKRDELRFKGCNLQDNNILSDCGVTAFSTVQVYMPHLYFEIHVFTVTRKRISFNVQENCLIEDLKLMIQDKEGIPQDQQKFVYDGRQLEDGRTLRDYGITKGSVLNLILRLRGGGCLPDNVAHHESADYIDDKVLPVGRSPVLTVGHALNVDPQNLGVGKIVAGKRLQEENTRKSPLKPLMCYATYLQFEIYIDCE